MNELPTDTTLKPLTRLDPVSASRDPNRLGNDGIGNNGLPLLARHHASDAVHLAINLQPPHPHGMLSLGCHHKFSSPCHCSVHAM